MGLFSGLIKKADKILGISDLWNEGSDIMGQSALAYAKPKMDYQYNLERDSRQTYYQDSVQSMRNAGLNPILAAGSIGSGSLNVSPDNENPVMSSINSAIAARTAKANIENLEAQNDNIHAQNSKIKAETANINENTRLQKYGSGLKLLGDIFDPWAASVKDLSHDASGILKSVLDSGLNTAPMVLKGKVDHYQDLADLPSETAMRILLPKSLFNKGTKNEKRNRRRYK